MANRMFEYGFVDPKLSAEERIVYIYALYSEASRIVGPSAPVDFSTLYGNLAAGVAVAIQIVYNKSIEAVDAAAGRSVEKRGRETFIKDVTHLIEVSRAEASPSKGWA